MPAVAFSNVAQLTPARLAAGQKLFTQDWKSARAGSGSASASMSAGAAPKIKALECLSIRMGVNLATGPGKT
jgi:hypothetical protein